jgi:hypothetical protein
MIKCVGQNGDHSATAGDGSRVAQPRKDWYALCGRSGLGKKVVEGDGKTSTRYEGLQMHDLRRSAVRRLIRLAVGRKSR